MKDKETMKEKLHETADKVKEKAETVKEDIKKGAHMAKEKAGEMKENLKEKAQTAKIKAEEVKDNVKEKAHEMKEKVADKAKMKKEQENKVDFIQIADIENVPKQTIEAIRRDFDLIPEKHKQMMKGYVKEIKVREEKNPQYHREDRIIYVSKDYTKGEVLHEFAHGIETKFAFHKDPNYIKVLNHGLENIGIGDIIYDEETFIFPIYRLENSKFISEYQGRLYEEDLNGNGRFDNKAGTLNALCLGEYFSEGYKEYFINSEHLKLKDNMLYQFINEL